MKNIGKAAASRKLSKACRSLKISFFTIHSGYATFKSQRRGLRGAVSQCMPLAVGAIRVLTI